MTENKTIYWGFGTTLAWAIFLAVIFSWLQTTTLTFITGLPRPTFPALPFQDRLSLFSNQGSAICVSIFVTTGICSLLLAAIIKLKKGASLKHYLALNPIKLKETFYWTLASLALIALSDALTVFSGRPLVPGFLSTIYASTKPVWLFWIAAMIMAPVFEECFFRGFIMTGLRASILGAYGAMACSAAAWTLTHAVQYDFFELATIFLFGCLLGIARIKGKSLLLPLGLHSLANLIATIETVLFMP